MKKKDFRLQMSLNLFPIYILNNIHLWSARCQPPIYIINNIQSVVARCQLYF